METRRRGKQVVEFKPRGREVHTNHQCYDMKP
jgi:hypothetical protein